VVTPIGEGRPRNGRTAMSFQTKYFPLDETDERNSKEERR